MTEDVPPLIAEKPDDPATRSLADDVRQLVEDGRTLVEAELAYHKSRMAVAGQGIKGVAGWSLLALALVYFALMALVVGVLIGLSQIIGGWLATIVMVAVLLLAAGLSAWIAGRRWSRMSRQLDEET